MKRSIIQLGEKTHVVSLPQHWMEKLGLKKKDEVEVTERGEDLIISSEKKQSKKTMQITLSAKDKKFIRHLFSILGSLAYDEVKIMVDNSDLIPILHSTAHEYSNFVLVEQTKNTCVYKMVSKESKEDFDYILERCFTVTQSLADNFLEVIKAGNLKELEALMALETTNNQLTTIGERILIKSGYKDQDKTCFVYLLLWNLEIIADFYRRACYFLLGEARGKTKLSKEVIDLIGQTNELLRRLSTLSKEASVESFIEIFGIKAQIGDKTDAVFKKGNYAEIVIGHYLLDITTYIQDCAIAYLGISYGKKEDKD